MKRFQPSPKGLSLLVFSAVLLFALWGISTGFPASGNAERAAGPPTAPGHTHSEGFRETDAEERVGSLAEAQARTAPPDMQEAAARRMDPATGDVPSERRWAVLEQLQAQMPEPMQLRSSAAAADFSWVPVDDRLASLAVTAIDADPNDPQIFYFATGEGWFNADAVRGAGVWKSTDAGSTWERLASTDSSLFHYCQDLVVHPSGDVYVATRSGGVQRSQDGGLSWTQVLGSGNGSARNTACDLELTADGGVFAGIGIFDTDGIYYSDSGDPGTWTKQTNGFPGSGIWRVEIATAASNPDVAYAVPLATDYLIEGVYRTEDRGTTWTAIENPGGDREFAARQGWYDLIISVDPNDEDHVVAGGLHLWRSRDGGQSWDQISSGRPGSSLTRYVHVDQHNVIWQNSDTVYFTNDGGIYRCDNFTDDVPIIYQRNKNYNSTQYYAADIARQAGDPRVLGGTQDNGSTISLGEGLGPAKFVSGADGSYCNFDPRDGDRFYTSKQYQPIYRFDNGGFELADTLRNNNVDNGDLRFINAIELDPVDPGILYQASSRGLQRLKGADTASGSGWEAASRFYGEISAIGIAEDVPHTVFLGRRTSNAEIARLDNAHLTGDGDQPIGLDPNNDLPDASGLGSVWCTSIWVNPFDANHVLVSYGNYGVNSLWESTNALDPEPRWHSVEGNLPDVPVNWVMAHPKKPDLVWAATDLGIWYTEALNGDSTQWQACSGFPFVRTDMIRLRRSDYTMVAATHGRGIWTAALDALGSIADPQWQERGPTNVGGRTRALLIDPNDPSGQTVWAGSVSGGLWYTRGISAVGLSSPEAESLRATAQPNPFGQEGVLLRLEGEALPPGQWAILDPWGRRVATLDASDAGQVAAVAGAGIRWQPAPGLPTGLYTARWTPESGRLPSGFDAPVLRLLYRP
jgi:photosystem II stability/assembly factor-like uncharacterized protein